MDHVTDKIASVGNFGIERIGQGRAVSKPNESGAEGVSFENLLREHINDVDKLQHDATSAIEKVSTGASDTVSTPVDNVKAGRLLHAAGLSGSTRIVDTCHEVTRPMLREIDHWIMDGICT